MIDLTTEYCGLKLDNPLVPSSSPLTGSLEQLKRLEDAGASAVVLPSLFEEAVHNEQKQLEHFVHLQSLGHSEAEGFQPVPEDYSGELDNYLEHLRKARKELSIPVIASLNGISNDGWLEYGKELVAAGADALELNVYYIAANPDMSGAEVEQRYLELLSQLRSYIDVPVIMKLSSQFSSPGHMIKKLEQSGADGVVMYNRFYQPDIDLESLHIKPRLQLSSSDEALLRVRWIALLRSHVNLSLAATGGFHYRDDILKALLAGSDAVYLCSALLQNGAGYIGRLLDELRDWLVEKEYESVSQMKGSVNQQCAIDPAAYEHSNYLEILKSYPSF